MARMRLSQVDDKDDYFAILKYKYPGIAVENGAPEILGIILRLLSRLSNFKS